MNEVNRKDVAELKDKMHKKLEDAIDAIVVLGKQKFFEVHLKNLNGDIITKIIYTDKDKVVQPGPK